MAALFAATTGAAWIGSMRGTARITGDLVEPAASAEDWEVTRE